MKKKSIISIVLVLSIIASLFTISAISTSAAGKPVLSVANVTGGQNLSWNKNGNNGRIYLYFGYGLRNSDGKIISTKWTHYREVSGSELTISATQLKQSAWKKYKKNTTPIEKELKSERAYCYQIQVGAIGSVGTPKGGSNSSVKSLTYLGVPSLSGANKGLKTHYIYWNKIAGATSYEIKRLTTYNSNKCYVGFPKNINDTEWYDDSSLSGEYYYQIRAVYKTKSCGTAYSAWSKIYKMVWTVGHMSVRWSATKSDWEIMWDVPYKTHGNQRVEVYCYDGATTSFTYNGKEFKPSTVRFFSAIVNTNSITLKNVKTQSHAHVGVRVYLIRPKDEMKIVDRSFFVQMN